MRKTETYPEFKLEYLQIDEAISFSYISGPKPPEYLFKEQYADILSRYRQSITVYIMPTSKEKIIEIIKKVEQLEFVRDVSPNIIFELEQ